MGKTQEVDNTPTNPQDSGSPPAADETTPAANEETPAVEPQEETPPENSIENLPDWAQREIRSLRRESAQRRVESNTLSSQVEQMTSMFQQVAEHLQPSSEETSDEEQPETPPVPETPDQMADVVETILGTLGSLSRENTVMRVANETGLPLEIVQGIRGNTYEELSEAASGLAEYVQENQGATPDAPPAQPPRAPSGSESVGATDAQRQQRYFGQGPTDAGIFAESGGVVTHDLND